MTGLAAIIIYLGIGYLTARALAPHWNRRYKARWPTLHDMGERPHLEIGFTLFCWPLLAPIYTVTWLINRIITLTDQDTNHD